MSHIVLLIIMKKKKNKIYVYGAVALLLGTIFLSCISAKTITNEEDTTPPSVWFTSPKKGFFYPFLKPIIIGSTQIWAHASDDESEIDYCELYIDDELKATFNQQFPRSWTWSETYAAPYFKHTIKGVAYDTAENSGSDEITVWKFF